jgi:hypothetical protein
MRKRGFKVEEARKPFPFGRVSKRPYDYSYSYAYSYTYSYSYSYSYKIMAQGVEIPKSPNS